MNGFAGETLRRVRQANEEVTMENVSIMLVCLCFHVELLFVMIVILNEQRPQKSCEKKH